MGKTFLLPQKPKYKANLHCHTTLSDGELTPEQIKEEYKKRGYSIVAYTDHEYIVNHQDLNDENFIAITAYEYSINEAPHDERTAWTDLRCCHLNLYAKDPYQDKHVCFAPSYVWGPGKEIADTLKYTGPLYKRDYNDIQHVIDEANKNGYLVCFNHPYWSLQPQSDYFGLKGLFAMETYNTGCYEFSGHSFYDYGLLAEFNQSIAPVATDDNHNHFRDPDLDHSDSFGGYTMIYTGDFSYTGIIKALEEQQFYASTGIDFEEISVENGVVHVECTPSTSISIAFGGKRWDERLCYDREPLTSADFTIPWGARYIRVYCVNRRTGANATTKAFALPKDAE